MENNYTVYMHISPSGKRYIGITSRKVEKRWQNGKGYPNNKHFTDAINLYGWENFEHIIVAKGLTKEEAGWIETVLIAEYDTTNQDKGYNITKGGEGTKGVNPRDYMTEETKREHDRKLSEAQKGKKRPEHSERMSGESNPMYRKNPRDYMTEEAKIEQSRKMSENHADFNGKNHPYAKSVIAIINDKIFGAFDYITQGAKYFGCDQGHISNCCRGKYKSAGKYNVQKIIWRYLTIKEL